MFPKGKLADIFAINTIAFVNMYNPPPHNRPNVIDITLTATVIIP